MLFIDGGKDMPGKRYTEFWPKMDELGIHREFLELDGAPHAFWNTKIWYDQAIEAADKFLREQWR